MATIQKKVDVDGADAVSKVLLTLLNTYPGLNGKSILFSTLGETSGVAFFPTSGAAILSNKEDITGHVKQVCLFPFIIVYRAAPKTETQRIRIKEFLDSVGKWLELQPICIDQKHYKLTEYPPLSDRYCYTLQTEHGAPLETQRGDELQTEDSDMDFSPCVRKIKSISRTSTGYLDAAYQNGIEDWVLSATLRYENEFDK